jgi:hypothetical protein
MFMVCIKCGYDLIWLNNIVGGTLVDAWDEDEVCYDEYTNMIGDGKHYVQVPE